MRKLKEINNFIYISSNLRPPIKNFLDFASIENKPGLDPFIVKQVIPLDLAPHSLRCDMVILCERLSAEKIPKSHRKYPKAAKQFSKNISGEQKKTRQDSACSSRSSYFPTEEMVRRYSNFKKPKQEIDYQKRDSLYPLPLRGALYQGFENEGSSCYPNGAYEYQRHHGSETKYANRNACHNNGRYIDRYSDFCHDMESALDETPYYSPGQQLTSRKLAYANALLEEGIRIASEVLDNDYTKIRSSTAGCYDKQKIPYSRNKYKY